MNMTRTPKLVAAAAAGTLLLGSAAAVAATAPSSSNTPANGTVHIWVTPSNGAVDKILLTGAIGDYGTATSTDKSGKVDTNGNYVKIKLQQGTFEVNAVRFGKKLGATQPNVNKSTCTAWISAGGPISLYDGTGLYAGIKGTARISTSFAALLPRFKSGAKQGQCNLANNATPVKEFDGPIVGQGHVTFSG
jgi:hypothetical protein